jgi:hypothetical protein
MKHLNERDMSGVLDGELRGEAMWRAQQHLERCPVCRDALSAMAAQDRSLRAPLSHDPGEEYFDSFADRVTARIAAAPKASASEVLRSPFGVSWWQSPRKLALVGTVTAVIAGAGLVMISSRNAGLPTLANKETAQHLDQTAPAKQNENEAMPGTAAGPGPGDLRADRSKDDGTGAKLQTGASGGSANAGDELARTSPPGAASPGRQQKVMSSPSGEDRAPAANGFTPPPPASSAETREVDRLRETKRRLIGAPAREAQESAKAPAEPPAPMREESGSPAPAAAPLPVQMSKHVSAPASRSAAERERMATDAGPARRVCGVVRDASGRPLARVLVTATDAAGNETSDGSGRFCLELPPGPHDLQLLAVGFRSAQIRVPATSGEELAATMQAVSVIEGGGVAGLRDRAEKSSLKQGLTSTTQAPMASGTLSGSGETLAGDETALKALPDSLRDAVAAVMKLQSGAETLGRANALDAAAAAWERVLPQMPPGRSELEARARLAECRFRAWQISRDSKRAERAMDALTAFIVRTPSGDRRSAVAARWIDQIHER